MPEGRQLRRAPTDAERYALFDEYADLALRGLCSLQEAMNSYQWELDYSRHFHGKLSHDPKPAPPSDNPPPF